MVIHHSLDRAAFSMPAEAELPSLDAVEGLTAVAAADVATLHSTYFDTPDFRLLKAGVTIKRQAGGHDDGWHLVVSTTDGHHLVRLPLGQAIHTVPKPLRSAVTAHSRGQELTAVLTLHTRRRLHRLHGDDGENVAEVTEDESTAEASADSGKGDAKRAWRHVTVSETGPAWRVRLSTHLLEAGASPEEPAAALAHALGHEIETPTATPPPAAGLRKSSPASLVVHARLAEQVRAMLQMDPLVRLDTPDSVHRMRVAIRRLRSALATFGALLAEEVTDSLRQELKWVADALGEVRDTEVFHDRLHELVASAPQHHKELYDAGVMTMVDGALRERYQQTHQAALQALDSERYSALLDQLPQLISGPACSAAAERSAKAVLPKMVLKDYARLRRRIKAAEKAEPGQREILLHEARKAAKRVRYAAETLAPVYGNKARRFVKALKRVQSNLGDHHDSAVSRQELRDMARRAAEERVDALPLGLLHCREESEAAEAEAAFREAWAKASKPKRRRWLQ